MSDNGAVAVAESLSLDGIFRPRSVAVVGASRREETVGHAVLRNLIQAGFKGALYPVNPKAESLLSLPCHPSISEIPGPVDLAVFIVPAPSLLPAFEEGVRKGIRGAVVISAGFKETGPEGAWLERQLAELARRHQIPTIGPNCLGVINADPGVRLNASFARTMPRSGRVGFISQSGALCAAILDYAKGNGIGFSKFISMGNKAVLTELELVEYLGSDPDTDVILLYLEDLAKPHPMIEVCRRVSGETNPTKPILAIKSGRTLEGTRAASSHTGSLAGSDEVYTAIFAQGGILRVDTVEELFDYARAFSLRKLPRGRRVGIVTNAGGPGIMATDAAVKYGLEMALLSEETRVALRQCLPPMASTVNPVDMIGDARHDRYQAALDAALRDPGVDAAVAILTPQAMTDIAETARVIGETAHRAEKPLLACLMGVVDISEGERVLEEWHVPNYRFPESAVRALAAMVRYTAWIGRPRTEIRTFPGDRSATQGILRAALGEGRKSLLETEAVSLLEAYGFPVLPTVRCASAEAAAEAAERMGFPVALKISSPDILHKVDVGGVLLSLRSASEVVEAARLMLGEIGRRVPSASALGLTVQKMAEPGREVILGFQRHAQFGPLLLFGLGGTYVEVFKDVTFRIAPIRQLGAQNMIRSIRGYPILEGIRGQKRVDLEKIEECLERLSQLAMECAEISELDINPLVAYDQGQGCAVVDARILLG